MQNKEVLILAIESSCDDTSCAVLRNKKVLSNVTAAQEIHQLYGGVVPELASRDHEKNIVPVVHAALAKAQISLENIDLIAVTSGPGLMGSLLVGMSFAKSLALALNKPFVEVNHMQAHVLAHFIDGAEQPDFPFLCLTVSGGHTQLIEVKDHLQFELIGQTTDDAVGEAFDKAAKILGLPYPGGPLIDHYAKSGNEKRFSFADSKMSGNDLSFSGIKTSFLYFIRDQVKENENFIKENLNDICASYQKHLVNILLKKVKNLIKEKGYKHFALAGGVSANSKLREEALLLEKEFGVKVHIPKFEYCTDNAAMIGVTAYYKFISGETSPLTVIPKVRAGI
jgi:N6-L-threonylcarbamoyladenine synthase